MDMSKKSDENSTRLWARLFRFYYRGKEYHPVVILSQEGNEVVGIVISHSPGDKRHSAVELTESPYELDVRKSYLQTKYKKGTIGKEFSSKTLKGFQLSNEDEDTLTTMHLSRERGNLFHSSFNESRKKRIKKGRPPGKPDNRTAKKIKPKHNRVVKSKK